MRPSEAIAFYSRKDVAEELVRAAKSREVAVSYSGKGYGKRPDILEFPADVEKLARLGVTSFHMSEEKWSDPLALGEGSNKKSMDELRSGWDLIIDLDCPGIEYAKLAAKLILEAFKYHGIKNFSLKYSGGSGLHIGLHFKTLPKEVHGKAIETLFPEAPRIVAAYLKEFIRPHLQDLILEKFTLKQMTEDTKKDKMALIKNTADGPQLDPFEVIGVDTVAISPRHLIRMPYSFNEKKGLVSVSLDYSELDSFTIEMAKPENVKEVRNTFLNEELFEDGEAAQLIVEAFDWAARQEVKKTIDSSKHIDYEGLVPEDIIAPCIKHILKGKMSDGRKRALLILLNFLRGVGWGWPEIESRIEEWNNANDPPLKEGYIKSQISWHKRQNNKIPPPNCDSPLFADIGVPKELCRGMKNSLAWTIRRAKIPNKKT